MKAVTRGVAAHVRGVRGPIGLAVRLWRAISEPRHLKIAYLAIYVATAIIGIVTLLHPPMSVEGPLGATLATIWACLYMIGGLVAAVAVLPGWWWAERLLGIIPILGGMAMYLAVVIWQHRHAVEAGGSRLTQIGIILLACSPFILRGLLIRSYSYEPRR